MFGLLHLIYPARAPAERAFDQVIYAQIEDSGVSGVSALSEIDQFIYGLDEDRDVSVYPKGSKLTRLYTAGSRDN